MKRNYLPAILLIVVVVISGAASLGPSPSTEGYKNLKVLQKDITKQQLDSVMAHFCVSLGVKCNFCHAPMADTLNKHLDFASDAKEEKNTAREMFRMAAY